MPRPHAFTCSVSDFRSMWNPCVDWERGCRLALRSLQGEDSTDMSEQLLVQVGDEVDKVDGDGLAARRAGFLRVQENELRDLATIGTHLAGKGALQVCRGKAIVHQQQINCMIHALSRTILDLQEKPKKTKSDLAAMAQLSRSLASLSAQLTDSQRLLLEVENLSSTGDGGSQEPLVPSFAPGSIVVPRQDHCPVRQLPMRDGS